jgi:hypothetical protein
MAYGQEIGKVRLFEFGKAGYLYPDDHSTSEFHAFQHDPAVQIIVKCLSLENTATANRAKILFKDFLSPE